MKAVFALTISAVLAMGMTSSAFAQDDMGTTPSIDQGQPSATAPDSGDMLMLDEKAHEQHLSAAMDHLNKAQEALNKGDTSAAKEHLQKAESLVKVTHDAFTEKPADKGEGAGMTGEGMGDQDRLTVPPEEGQGDFYIQDEGQEDLDLQDEGQEDFYIQDEGQEDFDLQDEGQDRLSVDEGQDMDLLAVPEEEKWRLDDVGADKGEIGEGADMDRNRERLMVDDEATDEGSLCPPEDVKSVDTEEQPADELKAVTGDQKMVAVDNEKCPLKEGKLDDPKNVASNLTREFNGKTIGFCDESSVSQWDKLSETEKNEKFNELGVIIGEDVEAKEQGLLDEGLTEEEGLVDEGAEIGDDEALTVDEGTDEGQDAYDVQPLPPLDAPKTEGAQPYTGEDATEMGEGKDRGRARGREKYAVVNNRCPILGTPLENKENVPALLTREYNGQRIGFCCAKCPEAWDLLSDEAKAKAFEESMKPVETPVEPVEPPVEGEIPGTPEVTEPAGVTGGIEIPALLRA